MFELKNFLIRDIEFKVHISGTGKPLVFFHGYGGSMKDWDDLKPYLNAECQIYIISLKPLIKSLRPISFSEQVGYLRELMEALFPQRPAIDTVSTSYGSALSWALFQVCNLQVDRNILINPMPLDPLMWMRSLELKLLAAVARSNLLLGLFLMTRRGQLHLLKLSKIFGLESRDAPAYKTFGKRKRLLIFGALQRFFWIARSEDWDKHLENAVKKGNALIVYGAGDPLFHGSDFKQYEKLFSESKTYRLAQGSHLLMKSHSQILGNIITAYLTNKITDHHQLFLTTAEATPEDLILESA